MMTSGVIVGEASSLGGDTEGEEDTAPPLPPPPVFTYLALSEMGCPTLCSTGAAGSQQVADLVSSMVMDSPDDDGGTVNTLPTIRAIHHIGGLSYAVGIDDRAWDEWLDTILEPYASRVPVMVAVGSAEVGVDSGGECGVPVSRRFESPPGVATPEVSLEEEDEDDGSDSNDSDGDTDTGGVFWYSYTHSLVHTIVLSSEHNLSEGSDQRSWLVNDLASVDRTVTPWVVVEIHRPPYNLGTAATPLNITRDEIENLFHDDVDLVLSGHTRSYLRTCDGLYRGLCGNNNSHEGGGPTYVTVGTGGAELDMDGIVDGGVDENGWTESFIGNKFGVGRVTVYNATVLHWEFVEVGGDIADEVWITRGR